MEAAWNVLFNGVAQNSHLVKSSLQRHCCADMIDFPAKGLTPGGPFGRSANLSQSITGGVR